MQLDLHCPLELRGAELLRDDRQHVRAYLRLCSLSQARIERFDARITWLDDEGHAIELPLSATLSIAGRGAALYTASTDLLPGATHIELVFTRVIYEGDKPVWMHNEAHLIDIPELPIPDGRELNRLIALAGDDVVNFPLLTGRLWICVCGRPNAYRRKTCQRCARERDHVLSAYAMPTVMQGSVPPTAPLAVDAAPLSPKAAPPAEATTARNRFLRTRSLLIRRTLTMLIFAALIALIAWAVRDAPPEADAIAPVKIEDVALG